MIRLTDLTAIQIRMMAALDDGHPHEDSTGKRFADMEGWELTTVEDLLDLGLAEESITQTVDGGFGAWFRLTERGRRVRDEGWAE